VARRGWTVRRLLGALALGLVGTAACSAGDDSPPAPAPAAPEPGPDPTSEPDPPADLEIVELNFGDLTLAEDPVLRALASPDTSSWRPATDRPDLEQAARDWFERPDGPNADVVGIPGTWAHPSGEVAVQFEVVGPDGRTVVATVLFGPPET
jgi:hypothetical protein